MRRATWAQNAALAWAEFLSTLSLRRATKAKNSMKERKKYFYPRSPCGERQAQACLGAATLPFLSTLSLRRATARFAARPGRKKYFYPRSPCGERRQHYGSFRDLTVISIHALLAESDQSSLGGRRQANISIHALLAESDFAEADCSNRSYISIHALLAESDPDAVPVNGNEPDFYPRSPCGERRALIAR